MFWVGDDRGAVSGVSRAFIYPWLSHSSYIFRILWGVGVRGIIFLILSRKDFSFPRYPTDEGERKRAPLLGVF